MESGKLHGVLCCIVYMWIRGCKEALVEGECKHSTWYECLSVLWLP